VGDALTRRYAVRRLEGLNDEELAGFLLQLVQVGGCWPCVRACVLVCASVLASLRLA
jgi:hypothetical protein